VELRLALRRSADAQVLANGVYPQEAEAAGSEVRDAVPAFDAAVAAAFARFVDDLAAASPTGTASAGDAP
jgi:ABC-type uncharacterized transport system auxiliary subunit